MGEEQPPRFKRDESEALSPKFFLFLGNSFLPGVKKGKGFEKFSTL